MIVLDLETAPVEPYLQFPPIACMALQAEERLLLPESAIVPGLTRAVLSQDVIIGHHIAFDLGCLIAHDPSLTPLVFQALDEGRIQDTEVRQKLIDIAHGEREYHSTLSGKRAKGEYNLAYLTERFFGTVLDKDTWRMKYGKLRHVPFQDWPQGAKDYPLSDVEHTWRLWQLQEKHAHFLKDQARQVRASFWLKLMSGWGVVTDQKAVDDLAQDTQRQIDAVYAHLQTVGLIRKNGTRDTKLAQAWIKRAYEQQGEACPLTEGGKGPIKNPQPALDEKSCIHSGDPIIVQYGRFSSLNSVLTSVCESMRPPVLHTYFDSCLETGRTSSSKPNLQNMRTLKGVRECLVPRPGCVFVVSDFSGLELSTLAQACRTLLGYSTLGDAINAKKDAHLMLASNIMGRPYDELRYIYKDVAQDHPEYQIVWDNRQTSKVGNFGFGGGMGPAAFVEYAESNYGVIISKPEAGKLKAIWLRTWAEMPEYFAWIDRTIQSQGGVWQLFSDRYRGDTRYTQACNTLFQGLGADIAKAAGWAISKACYVGPSSLLGCRPVLFGHDEFVLEVPEARCHEASEELPRLMIEASKPWLPDVALRCETVAMRRYSKGAKPTFKEGRMVAV